MSATPIPIGSLDGSCNECDLCCVLSSSADAPCTRLFWLCRCPTGVKVMQTRSFVGGVFTPWVDVASWVEDGEGFWYPYTTSRARITVEYRLKCTLPAGEVYFSNAVSTSLQHPDCYASASEFGPGELLACRIGWTRQDYDVNDVLINTVTGETVIGCNETFDYIDNSPFDRLRMQWQTLADGSGYRIRVYRELVGSGAIVQGSIWNSLRTGWTKLYKCFSAVHTLTLSGANFPISMRRAAPPPGGAVAPYSVLTVTAIGLEV